MAELQQISEIPNLSSEKWVEMNGKIVPIMKLERLAREDLDFCRIMYQIWLKTPNCPSRDYYFPKRIKWLDMAEKKLEQILFLRDTVPSLPPPCRVKVASTDGDESSDLELIPSYFFEEDDNSLELELIPQFFFDENEDVDSINGVSFHSEKLATPEMINFSELHPIKIGEVYDSALDFHLNKFEKNLENHEYLKELLSILYNKSDCVDCCSFHLDDTRCLFDRGKYVVLSSFTSEKNLEQLIHSFGYDSDLWFINLFALLCGNKAEIHDARKVFVEISKKNKILLLIMSRVVSQEYSAFTRSWRYRSELSSLCPVVHVYVNDNGVGNGNLLLVTMYEKDNILLASILPIEMVCQLVIFMVEMWREEFFHLHPQCGLGHEIAVYSLGLLVVTQIHLGSFACIYEFILFNTVIILHYGFLYLQLWNLFHLALLFHKAQGNWSVQISRSWSAFIRHVSSRIILVVSSAGDFSYEHLIFLLLPSLGYHLDFLAIQFIVFLCVTEADIVEERKLTITMAARTGIHLVENVLERLNCGNAQTFILAEWLEVSASEHEQKQWLPKTMYVYESISFLSSGYLLPGFSYFWGSASHLKVDYPRARYFIQSMRTQAMCIVFHFRFVWMLVYLFRWKSMLCSIVFSTVKQLVLDIIQIPSVSLVVSLRWKCQANVDAHFDCVLVRISVWALTEDILQLEDAFFGFDTKDEWMCNSWGRSTRYFSSMVAIIRETRTRYEQNSTRAND